MQTTEALHGLASTDSAQRFVTCKALAKAPSLDVVLLLPLLRLLVDRGGGSGSVNRGAGTEPDWVPISQAAKSCLRAHVRVHRAALEQSYFAGDARLQAQLRDVMPNGFVRGESDAALVSLGSAACRVTASVHRQRPIEFELEGDVQFDDSRRGRGRRQLTLPAVADLCRALALKRSVERSDLVDDRPVWSSWSFERSFRTEFVALRSADAPQQRLLMPLPRVIHALTHEVHWAIARSPRREPGLEALLTTLEEARVRFGLPQSEPSVPSPLSDLPLIELRGARGNPPGDAVQLLSAPEWVPVCEALARGDTPALLDPDAKGPLIIERALIIRALGLELPWLLSRLPKDHVDRPRLELSLVLLDAAMSAERFRPASSSRR